MAITSLFRTGLAFVVTLALIFALVPQLDAAASVDAPQVVGVEANSRTGAGPLAVEVPAATEAGDLLLAYFGVMDRKMVTAPAGWNLVSVHQHARQITQTVWTRVASDDEPPMYSWNGDDRRTTSGAIIAVRGVDTKDPLGEISSGHAVRSHPIVAPSVTPSTDGGLLLGFWGMGESGGVNAPKSMETIASLTESFSVTLAAEPAGAAHQPSGDRVATRSSHTSGVGHLLVVHPAAATQVPDEEDHEDQDHTEDEDHTENSGDEGDDQQADISLWTDPATWPSGQVPSTTDVVTIDKDVRIEGEARAAKVTVEDGVTLEFAPSADATLELTGNLVVEGNLRMQPASVDIDHVVRFLGVDEDAFVGGGHEVLDSDVGLWFTHHGHAEIEGSDRLSWTRSAETIGEGDNTILLEQDPSSWQLGDELVIAPTSAPGTSGHSTGYSAGRIILIDGRSVTLDTPFTFDHPRVNGRWGAEVMNMTRNVRIEGTPEGRAHVLFMHTHGKQTLRNLELRHLGPRQDNGDVYQSHSELVSITEGVMGRYPLHFHHGFDGSAGSLVENVVVRESGHKAFVTHASNGVTLRGTIAHDVFDTPYWWDRRTGCCGYNADWDPPSNDITYERAIASLVKTDPPFRGYRLAGFELGHGNDLSVTDSVAVGVQGNKHASGFNWPEGRAHESGDATIGDHWTFENNVSHNNKMNGIFTWQNGSNPNHLIGSSALFHNGRSGVTHGAYSSRYAYDDLDLYGNGRSGFELHAQGQMPLTNLRFDGAGVSQYGLVTSRHRAELAGATLRSATFTGYTDRAIALLSPDKEQLDVINPHFDGPESSWFRLGNDVPTDSVIRVQLSDGTAFQLHPASSSKGTPVIAWNARRQTIPPFA